MQYHCKTRKSWLTCKVTEVKPQGIFLSVRGTVLPASEVAQRVRAAPSGSAEGSADKSADGSGDGSGVGVTGKARGRGFFDAGWNKYVTSRVGKMGSVKAIFGKLKETFEKAEDLAALKDQLTRAFPKLARNNYAAFYSNPGGINKIEGELHPCRGKNHQLRKH